MVENGIVKGVNELVKKWRTNLSLPFENILPAKTVADTAERLGVTFRDRFFSPRHNIMGIPFPSVERGRILP